MIIDKGSMYFLFLKDSCFKVSGDMVVDETVGFCVSGLESWSDAERLGGVGKGNVCTGRGGVSSSVEESQAESQDSGLRGGLVGLVDLTKWNALGLSSSILRGSGRSGFGGWRRSMPLMQVVRWFPRRWRKAVGTLARRERYLRTSTAQSPKPALNRCSTAGSAAIAAARCCRCSVCKCLTVSSRISAFSNLE